MKMCVDPTFLGTAIYARVGHKLNKLSRLEVTRVSHDGIVHLDTLNRTYLAEFTDSEVRKAFMDTCRTINRLEED